MSRLHGTGQAAFWVNHADNPRNWSATRRWVTMCVSCSVTLIVGLNATCITTAADEISTEFGLENGKFEYNFLSVTAWSTAAAIVPLVTLPMMDTYGIKVGYSIAYVVFTLSLIPQALARNFATLVVCRVFAGAAGGTLQNTADGIAANLYITHEERTMPLTVYVLTLLLGVTLGPTLGAVVQPLGWRWIIWIQLIVCGAVLPVVLFGMRESRASVIFSRLYPNVADAAALTRSANPTKHEALREARETVTRSGILLTTEPIIISFTLWSAFVFGLIFAATQSVPLIFGPTYDWELYQSGLVQASIGLGQMVGLVACLAQNSIYLKSAASNNEQPGSPVPESILHLSIPSTVLGLAGGLFIYAWGPKQPHWVVPAFGLGLIGYASMVIVTAVSIYITDSYSGYAASAIAAIAFGENIMAAFLPLAAKPMYTTLGTSWASSLFAFAALVLTLAPSVLLWKGRSIRDCSPAIKVMKHVHDGEQQ